MPNGNSMEEFGTALIYFIEVMLNRAYGGPIKRRRILLFADELEKLSI